MKLPKYILPLGILAGLLILVLGFYSYINGLRSDGIKMETRISAQYESNQNELSAYVSTIYEQLGLADRKSAVLDTILTHAISGRYGEEGFKPNGTFFSAISEQYPDLTSNLSIYDKIADNVSAGRQSFKGKQNQLIDVVRSYKFYIEDGMVQRLILQNMLGFPTNTLEARIGGRVVATGRLALDKVQDIVLTSSTVESFTTGRQEPLKIK